MKAKKRKILIVEDAPHVARELAEDLRVAGWAARVTDTVERALSLFDEGHEFDAVLADCVLPCTGGGMSLLGILKYGRKFPGKLVLMSASTNPALVEWAEANGIPFLQKIFKAGELLDLLK